MFTGLVTFKASVVDVLPRDQVLELHIQRPLEFQEADVGDSVAVDGVCLTLEKQNSKTLVFALAYDTLQTISWTAENLKNKIVNLEPSLKVDQRWGGHFVTGHVDGRAQVLLIKDRGENRLVTFKFPKEFSKFLFKKSFITLNGVSLTIQEILDEGQARIGLVPETIKRTNLSELKENSFVTFEICYLTRTIYETLSKKTQHDNGSYSS